MRKNLDPRGRTVQHHHPFIFSVEGAAVQGAAEITADKAVRQAFLSGPVRVHSGRRSSQGLDGALTGKVPQASS